MAKKATVNPNDHLAECLKEFPHIPVVREYEPFKVAYVEKFGSVAGIQDWMKKRNLQNFRLDLCIPCVKMYVEVNGTGKGFAHKGAGTIRDYKKQNQLAQIGWRGLSYPALEVWDHAEIICEEIEELWQKCASGIWS